MTIEPKINYERFDSYGAKLLSFSIGFSDNSDTYHSTSRRMFPVKLKPKMSLRGIELKIDFEGDSKRDIEMNISRFISALYEGADILLPDGFWYFCVFENASAPEEKAPWIMQTKFSLSGIRHDALETTDSHTSSFDLFVKGNYETPAIIEAMCYGTEVTVAGITISNIYGTLVIDGLNCTVKQNSSNKFSYTDLTEFPKLQTGYNTIVISGNTSVKVSYYPIYI